jgi:outer membrane protein OmpA-like peptidoglycan-associated protein
MNTGKAHLILVLVAFVGVGASVATWTRSAAGRLAETQGKQPEAVATASASDMGYCTGDLKVILKRVLTSCGLVEGGAVGSARGCQPLQARQVAAMSGGDFNALFTPLADRAAIIQFDKDRAELDPVAADLLEKTFADRRGASYFFVVSRASPEGSVEHNRDLSHRRGSAVLDHIKSKFQDPDIDQEVGLLWLGEEFAQLDAQFCQWKRSRTGEACTAAELNRSSFIAWIDCRL